MMKLRSLLIVCLMLSFTRAYAQNDGLDENSFGREPFVDGQELNEGQSSDQDDGNSFPDDSEFGGIESSNSAPTENSQFDQAAPTGETPAELSDKIKNMTGAPLTTEQDFFPSFIYDERGRKDPFVPRLKVRDKVVGVTEQDITEESERVKEGLSKFEVSSLTLTAILIGKLNKPKALIKDPAGAVYVVHENDMIGRNNGVVRKIRQGQVVIVEYRDKEGDRLYTTQVLSLGK